MIPVAVALPLDGQHRGGLALERLSAWLSSSRV